MHTALHLLCSIVPLGVTGGQIGYEKSRLDFNDPDKQINKEDIPVDVALHLDDQEIEEEGINQTKCYVCSKNFKSMKALMNHKNSKVHKKKLAEFQMELEALDEDDISLEIEDDDKSFFSNGNSVHEDCSPSCLKKNDIIKHD